MPDQGTVLNLWVKRAHRGPMDKCERFALLEDKGVDGSADQGGYRQVSIISREVFEEVSAELGVEVDPAVRRANVLVEGVDLSDPRGRVLCLGETRIHIRGETKPCERMDEAVPGLQAALRDGWRGGCFGRVVSGGEVKVGDAAWLEDV